LFHGRLVTVEAVTSAGLPVTVEFVDEGGRTRQFSWIPFWELTRLPFPDEEVLDNISKLARPRLTHTEWRRREAEAWFADPRVGDCFNQGPRLFVTVKELREDGSIVCEQKVLTYEGAVDSIEPWIFQSAEDFRKRFENKHSPGYCLMACSSLRPEDVVESPAARIAMELNSPLSDCADETYKERLVK
jgi:hypothetical protein